MLHAGQVVSHIDFRSTLHCMRFVFYLRNRFVDWFIRVKLRRGLHLLNLFLSATDMRSIYLVRHSPLLYVIAVCNKYVHIR